MANETIVKYKYSFLETIIPKLNIIVYIIVYIIPLELSQKGSQTVLSGCGIGLRRTHALREFHSASENGGIFRGFKYLKKTGK